MRRTAFRAGLTLAVWVMLAACPLFVDGWNLNQLSQYLTYGIFAMSLGFIWGQVGLLCFGQAVFFGVGCYVMAVVTLDMLPVVPDHPFAGIVGAMLVAGLLANLAGRMLFHGRGVSGAYFAIATLSASVVFERVASRWDFIGGFNGLLAIPPLRITGSYLGAVSSYYLLLGIAAAVYLALLWITRAPLGTVLRAVRDGEVRTSYFGYDVSAYKVFSFTLSGAVAGLAGALFVTQFGFASPALIGFQLSIEVLVWVALGGREVLLAGLLGAILVRSVEGVLSETLGAYWLLALGAMFVVSVVMLPRGLLGWLFALPLPKRMRMLDRIRNSRAP